MTSQEKVEAFLLKKKDSPNADLAEKWREMDDYYTKKLWHPLTVTLSQHMNDELFTMSENLRELYDNFIHDFEHRINPLQLIEIVLPIARNIAKDDNEAACMFIKSLETTVKNDQEATIRARTGLAEFKLELKDANGRCSDIQQVRTLIEETGAELDKLTGVSSVHAPFYKVSSVYLREVGDYAAYYREALRYLGCESSHKLSENERRLQAVCLGFAALLGENVYNFGELLAHPILRSLEGTNEKWLLNVLLAFNSGDLVRFHECRSSWSEWDDLKKHQSFLEQKLRLLCLMEMSMARPSNNRSLGFDEISAKAQVKPDEVELLVMKALSRGLIRGSIDQLDRRFNVTWVQPRVLDSKQIDAMSKRMDEWHADVASMDNLVTVNAKEIITKG